MELNAFKDQLGDYIAMACGADRVQVLELELLSGGAIQDNYALKLAIEGGAWTGRQSWVLRCDAPSGVAASLSRAQEFKVLQIAHANGIKVPEPLHLCEDRRVIGKTFYLMRRLPGIAAAHQVVRRYPSPALAKALAVQLARLHRITPPQAELDFLPLPQPSPALSRIALYRGYLDVLPQARPTLEWAFELAGATGLRQH